jgi:short-subunit dehydrogenase
MQKIIIIGATSGIGSALAKLYLQNGDKVAVTGRRKNLLDKLEQESQSKIITECFDVTGNENIAHLKSIIEKLGGLDVLIYNAGYGDVSKSLDWEIDRRTTKTNVNGFIEIVNYAFNYFVKQGYGQIAGTSSIASIRGNSWAPAYSASKAFMSVYMEGLRMKASKMKINIAVTDILPGFVNTKMSKGNRQFWIVPLQKAAKQIFHAIQKKKRRAYISHRWIIIAWLLKWVPYSIYKRLG